MSLVNDVRRFAAEMGVEWTPAEAADFTRKVATLVACVHGRDWSWMRDTPTAAAVQAAKDRYERESGRSVTVPEFLEVRSMLLAIDARVNPRRRD